MIRHVLSVKLIFFDFPSDIGPTFCGMGELRTDVTKLEGAVSAECNEIVASKKFRNLKRQSLHLSLI